MDWEKSGDTLAPACVLREARPGNNSNRTCDTTNNAACLVWLLHASTHLFFTKASWHRYFYELCFIDGAVKAQSGQVTSPRSHS